MSKVRYKILDAGIVPEGPVKQMENWRMVPAGSSKAVRQASVPKVTKLREEVSLSHLPTMRETVLDISKIMREAHPVILTFNKTTQMHVPAGVDRLGRYYIEVPQEREEFQFLSPVIQTGATLLDNRLSFPRNKRTITAVNVLYETKDNGISRPTHWMCESTSSGEESIVSLDNRP